MTDLAIYDEVLRGSMWFERYNHPARTELETTLRQALVNITEKLYSSKRLSEKARLRAVAKTIIEELGDAYKPLLSNIVTDMEAAAMLTYEHLGAVTGISFTALPKTTLQNIINTQTLIDGYTLSDLIKSTEANHVRQFKRIMAIGVTEGKGIEEIVRDIRKKNDKLTKAQIRTVTNTAVGQARADSQYAAYRQMEKSGVIVGYEFIATLDSRTSKICAANDGRRFYGKIEEMPNKPKLHMNCRSVVSPITRSTKDGARASKDGAIPDESFNQWFNRQDSTFQHKYLGRSRYNLYKEKRLYVATFADIRKGRPLTLEQIRDRLGI